MYVFFGQIFVEDGRKVFFLWGGERIFIYFFNFFWRGPRTFLFGLKRKIWGPKKLFRRESKIFFVERIIFFFFFLVVEKFIFWRGYKLFCVFVCSSLLPWGRDQYFLGITGFLFFQIELKPVRRVSADANLKRFQHKVL